MGKGKRTREGMLSGRLPRGRPGLSPVGSRVGQGAGASIPHLCQPLAEGFSLVGEGRRPWALGAGPARWPRQKQRSSRLTGVCTKQPYPGSVSGQGRGWGTHRICCSSHSATSSKPQWLPVAFWVTSKLPSTSCISFSGSCSYGLREAQQMVSV